jgi:hypothetical protein
VLVPVALFRHLQIIGLVLTQSCSMRDTGWEPGRHGPAAQVMITVRAGRHALEAYSRLRATGKEPRADGKRSAGRIGGSLAAQT